MDGEGYITYAHAKVFCTSKGAGCSSICTFHAECALCVDPSINFFCKIFSDDYDLRSLIKDASLCSEVVYQYINFSKRKRELSFASGSELQYRHRVHTIATGLLKGGSLDTPRAKALGKLFADGRAACQNVCRSDLIQLTLEDPVHNLLG
jgi:hypothetical protein